MTDLDATTAYAAGRKPAPARKVVFLRLDAERHARLVEHSRRTGRTLTSTAIDALDDYLSVMPPGKVSSSSRHGTGSSDECECWYCQHGVIAP